MTISEEMRKQLIEKLYWWVEDPDSLTVLGFCVGNRRNYDRLKYLVKKYPDIYEAYHKVKIIIAKRRKEKKKE